MPRPERMPAPTTTGEQRQTAWQRLRPLTEPETNSSLRWLGGRAPILGRRGRAHLVQERPPTPMRARPPHAIPGRPPTRRRSETTHPPSEMGQPHTARARPPPAIGGQTSHTVVDRTATRRRRQAAERGRRQNSRTLSSEADQPHPAGERTAANSRTQSEADQPRAVGGRPPTSRRSQTHSPAVRGTPAARRQRQTTNLPPK
jgi:hypothetical protein